MLRTFLVFVGVIAVILCSLMLSMYVLDWMKFPELREHLTKLLSILHRGRRRSGHHAPRKSRRKKVSLRLRSPCRKPFRETQQVTSEQSPRRDGEGGPPHPRGFCIDVKRKGVWEKGFVRV